MKKIYYTFILGLITATNYAQETTINDALQLAVENLTGTARFRGMSGAFGAVGGDLSAINQNPAGSIFFANNFATGTLSNYNVNNNSLYYGTKTSQSDNSLDINQIGVVFVFKNENEKSDWKKMALAINYENTNNFSNSIYSKGVNPYNSISNYFFNFANNNVPVGILRNEDFYNLNFAEQQAFLGYDTFMFESTTANSNDNTYISNLPNGGNYLHKSNYFTTGFSGKITGNFSTSYKDKIFLGGNLNFHVVNIEKVFSVYESNTNALNPAPRSTITKILFENDLITTGGGFSFGLGAIIKPIDNVRLGIAYESPTWYRLTDELSQGIQTESINNPNGSSNPYSYYDPIVYDAYTVQTPSKWTGSFAYLFGKKGLISADISTKNYANTLFKPKTVLPYSTLNTIMNETLDNAIELRIGGEFKIKQVSIRGGYHFDQSPYKVDQTFGDLTGYTGGLGYNFGENRIDVAYTHEYRNMNQAFLSSGMTDPARINRKSNNVTISYSINF